MIPLNLPPLQQRKWREEMKLAIKSSSILIRSLKLEACLSGTVDDNAAFATLVTRSYQQRMTVGDAADPLLRQVLALKEESATVSGYVADPLEERQAQPLPGLIRKYHGRALVVVTGACAIHCRYCFRRHFPYHAGSAQITVDWQAILSALQADDSIHEVILSGGDPLMLSTEKLQRLNHDLARIKHIHTLRIHTRLPIVLPERITEALCRWLKDSRFNTVMVVHANHPNEMDDDVMAALKKLTRTGVTLLNQTVLLKGVNDDVAVLEKLSELLFKSKVMPYYLHDLDKVQGAHAFSLPQAQKMPLVQVLRSRLPGYLMPTFVREIPGEPYKTPLFPSL